VHQTLFTCALSHSLRTLTHHLLACFACYTALSSKQFNPLRAGFKRAEGDPNGCDTYARDCLNLGVKPDALIQKARSRFESAGGTVLENTSISGITVRPNGAEIAVQSDSPLTARLVLDCMGNGSPLVRQMRWGRKPEGTYCSICIYVYTNRSHHMSLEVYGFIYVYVYRNICIYMYTSVIMCYC
jgi:hypothetical protein